MGNSNTTLSNKAQLQGNKSNKSRTDTFDQSLNKQLNSPRSFSPNQYGYVEQANQVPCVPNLEHGNYSQHGNRSQVNNCDENNSKGYNQSEDGNFSYTGPQVKCTPWDVQESSVKDNSSYYDLYRRSERGSGYNLSEDDDFSFAGLNLEYKKNSHHDNKSQVNASDRNNFGGEIGNNSVPVGNLINIEPCKSTLDNVQTTYYTDLINDSDEGLDEQFDVLDILSFPSQWSSSSLEGTGFVDVPFESTEGKSIYQFFHRTSQSKDFRLTIVGVTRIENPFLHTMYMLKKEEMKSRNGHVDELYLYHGTKIENMEKICEDNLDWRMFSERHRFGQGVSFSPLATYSSHYCDSSEIKVMLLFKVLVSNVLVGSENMDIPPNDANVTFDTSIKEDTSVIVKYSDNEFYPLYKIIFKKCATKLKDAPTV